ncbi:MAG: ATP-binding protein [bacterium]
MQGHIKKRDEGNGSDTIYRPKYLKQNIHFEFCVALLDPYTYDPIHNISARWGLTWSVLLIGLLLFNLFSSHSFLHPVDLSALLLLVALFPTIGALGTINRNRETTIDQYNKDLEEVNEQRKKDFESLREQYDKLFMQIPVGMFKVDSNYKIQKINQYALRLIGLTTEEEAIGRRCRNLFCAHKSKNFPCSILTARQTRIEEEYALSVKGEQKTFIIKNCQRYTIDGELIIYGSAQNITRQKLLEAELIRNKNKIETIFDSFHDIIITIGPDHNIQSANKRLVNEIGLSIDQIIGKPCYMIRSYPGCISGKHQPNCKMKDVFIDGITKCDRRVIDTPNGKKRYEEVIYTPIKDAMGKVAQVIIVIRDITERELMQKQLARSESLVAMGEVAASVAHEINNPLGIVLGFSQRLLRRTNGDNQTFEELKIIESESLRCSRIIKSLLNFTRMSPTQKNLNDIWKVITSCLSLINYRLSKQKIKINLLGNHQPFEINIDAHKLQQVFLNLFINAAQAMPHGGEISVSVEKKKDPFENNQEYLQIIVADTGKGIEKENLPNVFKPFFSTKGEKGTGLGLSITHSIIEAHGGSIIAESTQGSGTRMIIDLPC